MTVVVATLGSAGDLHPFLAVARALREQGRDVLFLSQEPHRAEVEAQGVRFQPIATRRDHERTMRHPDLWHPVKGFGVLWRHLVVPALEPAVSVIERVQAASPSRRLVVFASPLVVGARLAATTLPIALTTGHTAPSALRSCQDPMYLGAWKVPAWVPVSMRRQLWHRLDRHKLQPLAAPRLNAWLTSRGQSVIEGPVFERWIHSPHRVVAMFPTYFGPMPTDWPVKVEITGFPLFDDGHDTPVDPELQELLSSGGAPLVVFYPGSTATRQFAQMRRLAEKIGGSGYRCLFLADAGRNSLEWRSAGVLSREHVHLPTVLPRTRCFVHHGGIGVIAQGLSAGAQQTAIPSAYDQHDNAWRLAALTDCAERRRGDSARHILDRLVAGDSVRSRIMDGPSLALSKPGRPNAAVQHMAELLMSDEH